MGERELDPGLDRAKLRIAVGQAIADFETLVAPSADAPTTQRVTQSGQGASLLGCDTCQLPLPRVSAADEAKQQAEGQLVVPFDADLPLLRIVVDELAALGKPS